MTKLYVPKGSEFRVNTYTEGDQYGASIVSLDDGAFVVIWTSRGQDGSGEGIYGQVYGVDLSAVGDEFRVNTYTAGYQGGASIARLVDGGFVVAWSSFGQDGSDYGVYSQIYSDEGVPIGSEFRVNTYTQGNQFDPIICSLDNGAFVVVWTSWGQDGSAYGVYGQVFSGDGTRISDEFRVNTFSAGNQYLPSITSLIHGGFVVTWGSQAQDGSGYGVYGQVYRSDGAAIGSEFRVNTYTFGDQNEPSVTRLENGGFVVAWYSLGQDGSGYGVYGQVYNSDGNRIGGEFRVNTYTHDWQYLPSVASLVNGGFVVTWQSGGIWSSLGQDGSESGVYGQVYSGDGSPVGGEFRVNTHTEDRQSFPSVASLADGGFVVTWQSNEQDGSYGGIYGQVYGGDGSPVGGEFRVNTYTAGNQVSASIASLDDGGFVVTWQSYGQDGSGFGVYSQLFSPLGNSPPTGAVTITGTAREGSTLTAVTTNIADADGLGSFSYQWFGNGAAITGATASTFTPGQAQVGQTITVRVSYIDGYGTAESLTSATTAEVEIGERIQRSQSFTLPENGYTTHLALTGSGNINGTGNALDNTISGNSGNNRLQGGAGDDTLTGAGGNDTLEGGTGHDLLRGGDGNDLLRGGSGDDTLEGGAGNDRLEGGPGNDLLRGGDGADWLFGGDGIDVLEGGNGPDTLDGGEGNDILRGGTGNDLLRGSNGADRLEGGAGNDRLFGGDGNDILRGGPGADSLNGGSGSDRLEGGDGNDLLNGDAGNDTLLGGLGRDTLNGGAGNDLLQGGDGADFLRGGDGNDTIDGGTGNDSLIAGEGVDVLTGGMGADIFVWRSANEIGLGISRDRITDFETGIDRIDLSGFAQNLSFIGTGAFTGAAGEVRLHVAGSNGFLQIDVTGNRSVDAALILDGVNSLDAGDLIL